MGGVLVLAHYHLISDIVRTKTHAFSLAWVFFCLRFASVPGRIFAAAEWLFALVPGVDCVRFLGRTIVRSRMLLTREKSCEFAWNSARFFLKRTIVRCRRLLTWEMPQMEPGHPACVPPSTNYCSVYRTVGLGLGVSESECQVAVALASWSTSSFGANNTIFA